MRRLRSRSGPAGLRGAAATVALSLASFTAPAIAWGSVTTPLPLLVKKRKSKDGLTAEQAADRRMPLQEQGRQMVEAGEIPAAAILYDGAADTHGDPILYLDAGNAHIMLATEQRDIAEAETAKLRAQTAQDILYFHLDERSDPDYRLVTDGEISGLLMRAGQLIEAADALIAAIESEQVAPASEPAPAPDEKKTNGRGMRLAGAGLTGLGVAGLAVGVTGLVLGGVHQSSADDPAVYGNAFDEVDAKGRRSNVMAIVGLAVGGVALATGVTLIIVGKRRRATADASPVDEASDDEDFSMALVPTGRGLALTGRF